MRCLSCGTETGSVAAQLMSDKTGEKHPPNILFNQPARSYSSTKKTSQVISPRKTIEMNPKTITPNTPIIEMVS